MKHLVAIIQGRQAISNLHAVISDSLGVISDFSLLSELLLALSAISSLLSAILLALSAIFHFYQRSSWHYQRFLLFYQRSSWHYQRFFTFISDPPGIISDFSLLSAILLALSAIFHFYQRFSWHYQRFLLFYQRSF